MTNYLRLNLSYLRKNKGENQTETATALGFKRNTYANYESGHTEPNIEAIIKIVKFWRVTVDDLLFKNLSDGKISPENTNAANGKISGKISGKVYPENDIVSLVKENLMERHPKVVTVDATGHDRAVLVPIRARAGYLSGYEDPEFIGTLPAYSIPGLSHGLYRLFEVQGDSMSPVLHNRDICIGQHVENLMQIRDDRVHVIVTKEAGIVVKRVLNRIKDEGLLVLKSDNYKDRDMHPTQVLEPDEVLEVWYVTGYLSRQLRPPGEQYSRLIDVEARLILIEDRMKKGGL